MLDLVRDVLDKQLVDREGRPFGKVDGIVLEVRGDAPPRVVALEVGAATRLGRLPLWVSRWLRPLAKRARATRIPKEAVIAVAKDVRVDVDAARTPAWSFERWLAERVLARLPGGR
jgi:hypothetical protein